MQMNQFDTNRSTSTLKKIATEASQLFQDDPLDYKGRPVTPKGVLETGTDPRNMDVIEMVVNNSKGKKILDIGIAYGIYSVVLKREFGFEVNGIDHPANIDGYCRLPIREGIEVAPCDLHVDKIPYLDNTFDTVIASEIVEHLLISPTALISKIFPIIKPMGKLIITTPNFASLSNIFQLIRGMNPCGHFSDEEIKNNNMLLDTRVHPREYTVKEIEKAYLVSGFFVSDIKTKIIKNFNHMTWRTKVLNILMKVAPKHRQRIVAIGVKLNRNDFSSKKLSLNFS